MGEQRGGSGGAVHHEAIKRYPVSRNPDGSLTRVCLGCGHDFVTRDARESLCDRCDGGEPFHEDASWSRP